MATTREKLYYMLQEISGYENRVYFNPPESVKVTYPCIVYSLLDITQFHADNRPYFGYDSYQVTHIYASIGQHELTRRLLEQEGFSFSRSFRSDGLYHDVLTYQTFISD